MLAGDVAEGVEGWEAGVGRWVAVVGAGGPIFLTAASPVVGFLGAASVAGVVDVMLQKALG